MIKLISIFCIFFVSSCQDYYDNTFVFHDKFNFEEILEGSLKICGRSIKGIKFDKLIIFPTKIDCEGKGLMIIKYNDGENLICNISYITIGIEDDDWHFFADKYRKKCEVE